MNADHDLLSSERLEDLLARFRARRIGLIGDLFLDRYLMIEPGVEEKSVETGLEAFQVTETRNSPGALGTIVNNLAALEVASLLPLAVIGEDGHGDDLLRELRKLEPVDLSGIVRSSERQTPTYAKPMRQNQAGEWGELNRLDFRDRGPLPSEAERQLIDTLVRRFEDVDGWIVLDQIVEPNWGVVNDQVRDRLRRESSSRDKPFVYVDSRRHLAEFDFGVVKCNQSELLEAVGASEQSEFGFEQLRLAAVQFARRTGMPALCTCGEAGILAALPTGESKLVAGFPVEGPTDIVGAGDSASSAIVATLLSGGDTIEACQLGNLAASITVQKIGETGSASPNELRARLRQIR